MRVVNGRLNIRTFILFTMAVAICGAVLAVRFPHDPYTRYQSFDDTIFHRLKWVYERIVFDPTPIDVLVIGSSRSARGINSADLEKDLAERGYDVRVSNFSIPASGFDERLTVIREALKHHQEIRLVIWGIAEAFPRDGHQIFADIGRSDEILSSPWLINRNFPQNLARLPYRQIEYWLATQVPDAFGIQEDFDPNTYAGTNPDHRLFNDSGWNGEFELPQLETQEHAAELKKESQIRRNSIRAPILPKFMTELEFGVSRSYVRELISLSKAKGFDVAFVFLPFFKGYDSPREEAWLSKYGPVWKADFLMNDPVNYIDAGHPSVIGTPKVTSWLADQVALLLSENSNEHTEK